MDPTRRLPARFVEQARAFAEGRETPAEPRDASTVVLMRDRDQPGDGGIGDGGIEVYLLRRSRGMAFAGGFCVFPGGGVDARDFDHEIAWAGPTPQEWAAEIGVPVPLARALVCAAVRETFEESGVLLAGPSATEVVADTTGDDWEQDRRRLEARELAFTDVLSARGLVLRTDLLAWWGSWITPVFEPKRYDTRFFLARLPEGQVTRDVSTESDEVRWMPVLEVLEAVETGRLAMLPPTYATCLEISEHDSVDVAMGAAADRDRSPILPEMQLDEDGGYLALPARLVSLGERVAATRGRR